MGKDPPFVVWIVHRQFPPFGRLSLVAGPSFVLIAESCLWLGLDGVSM